MFVDIVSVTYKNYQKLPNTVKTTIKYFTQRLPLRDQLM